MSHAALDELRGLQALRRGDYGAAASAYVDAATAAPKHPGLWLRAAAASMLSRNFGAGRTGLDRALALRISDPNDCAIAAQLLQRLGRTREAEEFFRDAVGAGDKSLDTLANLACTILKCGRWSEGFPLLDQASKTRPVAREAFAGIPEWAGHDLKGRTVCVVADQNVGDAVQFVRFVDHMKAAGAARVFVWCALPLANLLASAPGVDATVFMPMLCDYWACASSLPLHFGVTPENLPRPSPYLHAHAGRLAKWRAWLDLMAPGKLRVGVKITTSATGGEFRAIDGDELSPLSRVPEAFFVSLEASPNAAPTWATAFPESSNNIDDLAAMVAALDAVVTVDTSTAHLAGALGTTSVVLLCTGSDWRWLEDRADSPWYAQQRLVRQQLLGDWGPAVVEAAAAVGLIGSTIDEAECLR